MKEHDPYQLNAGNTLDEGDVYTKKDKPSSAELLRATLESASPKSIVDALVSSGMPDEQIQQITDRIRDGLEGEFFAEQAANREALSAPLTLDEQLLFLEVCQAKLSDKVAKEKSEAAPDKSQLWMLKYQQGGVWRLRDAIEECGEGATQDKIQLALERKRESLKADYPLITGDGYYGLQKNYLGYYTTGADFREAGILLSAIHDKPAEARQIIAESTES